LLVLGDQVVHVGLGLSELHLVHAFAGLPVEEGLSAEHGGELLGDALEHLLDGGGVAHEGDAHLEPLGRDVAHARLDVVGDPLNELRGVFVLHVEHLLVDLLGGHAAAEHALRGQLAPVAGVGSAHHVLGVEALLRELGHGERAVLLRSARGEGREADHEEVQPGEGDQVDGHLPEVGVELTGEPDAGGHAGDGGGDQVVEVTLGGGGQLEGAEANVVQCLVVDYLHDVCVLDQLMHGEGGVVGLHDGVGDLGRGEHGEGLHDPVGVLLPDLGDQQGAHAGASATAH